MFNERAGVRVEIDGRACIETQPGLMGHAVYGPYETLGPGKYRVEFQIEPLGAPDDDRDPLIAHFDVVAGPQVRLAEGLVFRSLLTPDGRFVVHFETGETLSGVEYRLYVNGVEPLRLEDAPVATRIDRVQPLPQRSSLPEFFRNHVSHFGRLFIAGIGVSVRGEDVIATCAGFSFYARIADDLNFVDEVLLRNCYNILTAEPVCVIDIGMNIGLTSLRLAGSPNVREVHAFEPFPMTFARAAANVALNPEQQAKIAMHNFGLFDSESEVTTYINSSDSGSYSVFGADRGESVTIQLRDAGATLRPIVEAAEARGLLVVLKVDCEGSEYAVFRSLAASGLIDRVAAYMVEYHRGHGTSSELTSRLVEAGFAVIDLGYCGTNGFFYAVRLGRNEGSAR